MQYIRKMLMPLLFLAVVATLWLAAGDRFTSRPLVLKPDGTLHYLDALAANDSRPVDLQPGSVVSALRLMVVG